VSRAPLRLAGLAWCLTLLFEIGFIGFGSANPDGGAADLVAAVLTFQSMATIGVLIVRRDAGNAVGWVFCAAPLLMMAGNFFGGYGEYALNTSRGSLPAGVVAGQLSVLWTMGVSLLVVVPLLFPDGHLPDPRWRPVGWLAAISLGCIWAGLLFWPGPVGAPLQRYQNPLGIPGFDYLTGAVFLLPVLGAAGITAMVVRYRRGTHIQRLQLRWFFASALVFPTLLVISLLTIDLPAFVFLGALWLIPAAIGIAILRYRLYEIDVIIRRTVTYGVLVGILGAGYLAGIWLLGDVLRSLTGASGAVAVTLTTLAVWAGFQPLRRRVQRAVDHRFARRHYDADHALAGLSSRLRDRVELEAIEIELLELVDATLQPRHASLWLRDREVLS